MTRQNPGRRLVTYLILVNLAALVPATAAFLLYGALEAILVFLTALTVSLLVIYWKEVK